MKKCLKTKPEPQCLTNFRYANNSASWDEFKNQAQGCYSILKNQMRTDQCGLCAYCEIRLDVNNEQIAHFHPKSDKNTEHNWALDWSNLWLACKGGSQSWMKDEKNFKLPLPENLSCDEHKTNRVVDDVVLAPDSIPAFPSIFRFEQFQDRIDLKVNSEACHKAGIDVEKAENTIREFNLNCDRLARARLAKLKPIENAKGKIRESTNGNPGKAKMAFEKLARMHLEKDSSGCWPEFFTLVRLIFKESAENYLRSVSYNG